MKYFVSLLLFKCRGFQTSHSFIVQKRALSVDKVIFLCFIRPVFCNSEGLGDKQKTVGVEMCSRCIGAVFMC